MSVQAITWALAQRTGDPRTKVVLICLANYAGPDGSCFPSHTLIAKQTEQARSTVRVKIARLERLGLLKHLQMLRQGGGQSSNMYYLQLHKGVRWGDEIDHLTYTPKDEPH